jgi:hypothetical protein
MQVDAHDVAVCGGGPAGIGAAVAAARMGCRVTLIERHPMLGGMGTAALVNNFCPAHYDRERFIIDGVFGELRRRLIARKALYAFRPGDTVHPRMEPYNPDVFAEEAIALCREAGVEVRLNARIVKAAFRTPRLCAIELYGGAYLNAAVVVDATGDATVAARAGVPCAFGQPGAHAVMPLTLCYLMGPLDLEAAQRGMPHAACIDQATGERYFYFSGSNPVVDGWIREGRRSGELTIPRDHISAILSVPGRPQVAAVNFGRVNIADPTDPVQLEAAAVEGRLQIQEGIRFFRKHLPGMANVELVQVARQIGVRESRQIEGLYTLTGADLRACRQFDDCIAQCCYAIDIHEPGQDTSILEPLARGRHFDIPWRCLVPREGPPNLIVAGRCISADQAAMSSFRVSPSCMAIGQAAGVGAALAAQTGYAVGQLPYSDIRLNLLKQGAILT